VSRENTTPPEADRPLAGVKVVVTRAEHQAAGLTAALAAAGATPEPLPLLAVVPPADGASLARAAAELALFDWAVFTSANAVRALLDALPAGGTLPPRLRLAAVGAATAAALRARGAEPRLVAESDEQSAGGLLRRLLPHLDCGQRVLLPVAADALPTLRDGLRAAGIAAVAVVAYDKALPPEAPARAAQLFAGQPLGWVTFSSPRIVRHFVELVERLDSPGIPGGWAHRRGELHAASIGPVTTAALRQHGIEPAAQASRPSEGDLVAAIASAHAAKKDL
jgi:uroporphyrinogen-III synthase